MLHAELTAAGRTCSVSVHVLLHKRALQGDVAKRALGFLFYVFLLAAEGLLTFFLLLHKALAGLVSVATSVGPP